MKVYYAHPMPLYGTKQESNEREQIINKFNKVEIIDPGSFQDNPEKQREGMKFCLKLVRKCKAVVFSKFKGEITAGVGKEVNYAIEKKIDVFELNGDKFHKIDKPVEYLSIMETISLPGYYPNR